VVSGADLSDLKPTPEISGVTRTPVSPGFHPLTRVRVGLMGLGLLVIRIWINSLLVLKQYFISSLYFQSDNRSDVIFYWTTNNMLCSNFVKFKSSNSHGLRFVTAWIHILRAVKTGYPFLNRTTLMGREFYWIGLKAGSKNTILVQAYTGCGLPDPKRAKYLVLLKYYKIIKIV
jgi:hypothetical protein